MGEITVRSRHLSSGYWNNLQLTEVAFRADPESRETIYATGDLGKILPDGRVLYLGRKDHQIQLRGIKVELAEIDARLVECEEILDAVTVLHWDEGGEDCLVAYIVPKRKKRPITREIQEFVRQSLPDHMVPSKCVFLESMPLNANGKVDRRRLPVPDSGRPKLNEAFVAPRTGNEQVMGGIWSDILKVKPVGVRDNFFDLGGHSLLAIKAISRINKRFGSDLPVRALFESPTVEQLAARLEGQTTMVGLGEQSSYSHLVELRGGPNKTPIFCFPYRCGVQGEYTHFLRLAKHMTEYSFHGLQVKAASGDEPTHATVEELAKTYVREIEDFAPGGPYYLIGDCAGAPEAYETARQLWKRGRRVGLLIFLDARGPYLGEQYWRIGPYSIRDLDRVRRRFVSSRLWKLAAATKSYWNESDKLPKGERWLNFVGKIKKVMRQSHLLQQYTSAWDENIVDEISQSETQLLEHVYRARGRYRSNWPSDYGGRLIVITNEQWYGFDRTLGWSGMAAEIETYAIPGNHISYMLDHVPLVAEQLRRCFEKSRE